MGLPKGKFSIKDAVIPKGKLSGLAKNIFVFFVLTAVVAGSFWISFLLGKRILSPITKAPEKVIKVVIPKPPPSLEKLVEKAKPEGKILVAKSRKEVKKKKAAKSKPSTHSYSARRYYKVQAGVYAHRGNASNLAGKLNAAGFATYIKKTSKGYRVQVGAFRGKTRAYSLKNTLIKKGFKAAIIYE